MSESFKFDIFLSHASKDKPIVRELANRLKADGLKVWLDEWEISPGDVIGLKIEEGLENSRTLLLFISSNALESPWVTLERQTSFFRDPTNSERRFIPLRLDDVALPDVLKSFAYVDWRSGAEEEYSRLLKVCRPSRRRRPKKDMPEVRVLQDDRSNLIRVTATPDGGIGLLGTEGGSIKLWNLATQKQIAALGGHRGPVVGLAITADGDWAASGSHDGRVLLWSLNKRNDPPKPSDPKSKYQESPRVTDVIQPRAGKIFGVAVPADGTFVAAGCEDHTIVLQGFLSRRAEARLRGHTGIVYDVAVTSDGATLLSGSQDGTVRAWRVSSGECLGELRGHKGPVRRVAISAAGKRGISCSEDQTVRVWDLTGMKEVVTLEGHLGQVVGVALTPDGRRGISSSKDDTLKVWDLDSGACTATLRGHSKAIFGVAITADGAHAISASEDQTLRYWDLPIESLDEGEVSRYTNAKVLLVGESGVGKSGLALRLSQDRFEATVSTDAAWATQLKLPNDCIDPDMEREIWLWDFGGQADYRLIQQLFMDETALAVLVFNPQSDNPFEGLSQWDRDITRAAQRPFKKLLVAGRIDRGGLTVSARSIESFRDQQHFDGYFETSALTGQGCADVHKAIVQTIAWADIPWTSSPRLFKLIKEAIVELKDRGKILLRTTELKQQLELRLPDKDVTMEDVRAVVGLLAGPGALCCLNFGDFILLQPEQINVYAAAVIRSVRKHSDEIGCILEERVLSAELDFQDAARLPRSDEQIVLRAMAQTFVDRSLCVREPTDAGILLIFPSYFRRERPQLAEHPTNCVTYHFTGSLDEIYATLVVRLIHTTAFEKDQLWRFAADFRTQEGKRIGVHMVKGEDAYGELSIYFDPSISADTQVTFITYVHDHLKGKDPNTKRVRHYVCGHCQSPAQERVVAQRLARKLPDIICANCENRIKLDDLIEQKFASGTLLDRVRRLDEEVQLQIDNESRELILVGHAFATAGEAGHIFRPVSNSDWGIDGEIEFKDYQGNASGKRVYLQLKSGDSYLRTRSRDGKEVFAIRKQRHTTYWQQQAYPVMLVVRTSDGAIRWMNVTEYLNAESARIERGKGPKNQIGKIVFDGEPFTALNLQRTRDRLIPPENIT